MLCRYCVVYFCPLRTFTARPCTTHGILHSMHTFYSICHPGTIPYDNSKLKKSTDSANLRHGRRPISKSRKLSCVASCDIMNCFETCNTNHRFDVVALYHLVPSIDIITVCSRLARYYFECNRISRGDCVVVNIPCRSPTHGSTL